MQNYFTCDLNFRLSAVFKVTFPSNHPSAHPSRGRFHKFVVPYNNSLRPAPNFYITKSFSKVGRRVRTVWRRSQNRFWNWPQNYTFLYKTKIFIVLENVGWCNFSTKQSLNFHNKKFPSFFLFNLSWRLIV